MLTKLTPYLRFDGNCEEALHYYKNILGGNFEIIQRFEAMGITNETKNKVLHAQYSIGTIVLFASDYSGETFSRGTGDTALSFDIDSEEEGKRIFNSLSEGGKVFVPFEKQFWGAWHGNFNDKYGIRWMFNM